jgi:predicted HicB family RNase H-like nuclease
MGSAGRPAHGYSAKVFWSDEDEAYVAVCPELNNISAFGESREEALRELDTAIELALDVYRQDKIPIPPPAEAKLYSGKFNVRVSKSLHAQIAAAAEEDDVSLNTKVVELLAEGVTRQRMPPRRSSSKRPPTAKRAGRRK